MKPLKTKAEAKFDVIAALVKQVTLTISQWDLGTEHGVRLIRSTGEEQVSQDKRSVITSRVYME